MRRLTSMLIVLGVLLSLAMPGVGAQEEPAVSVLQVVDSMPFGGEELGLDAPITLFFDRPLDCTTVADAVSIDPEVAGSASCGDDLTSLRFVPEDSLARGSDYTLQLADSLRGEDGARLLEPFTLRLNTVGFLQVSEVLPADDSFGVTTDSVITVIFNRPVVPLVAVEELDTLPDPLTFEPAVEGEGEWLNTSIYVFRAEPGLAGGVHYEVSVDAGLEAVDGSVQEESFGWSFVTQRPEIVSVFPEVLATDIRLDPMIQVTFNQPMNRQSVEENFYLRPFDQGEGTVVGTFDWVEDSTGFSFEPDDLLDLDSIYDFGFNAPATVSESGGAALTGSSTFGFITVPFPAIVGTDPFDGETNVQPYGGFRIFFASPMDRETLEGKIRIEPEPVREYELFYRDYDETLTVSFPIEPSTKYTVTIDPGMADVYGNAIERGLTFSYTTARVNPSVNLQVPGSVGFYNAYLDETRLFVTHRNISRLDLRLYQVPLVDFVRQVTGDRYYYPTEDYGPDPSRLVRDWQIVPDAPENAFRYELLNLGASSEVACNGSPPTRLKLGDIAIVTSDPDPVRARLAPPDGEVVELLYRDYSLTVVGGPVCANDLLWWEVELRDESRAWVAEGAGDEYFIDLRFGSQATEIAVAAPDSESDALAPGLYFLDVSSPDFNGPGPDIKHFLVVATANLTVKASLNGLVVWATDVQSGEPIVDMPLTVFDERFNALASGTTDANGIARIKTERVADLYVRRAVVLRTDDQFGIGVTEWTEGIDPWRFGQNYDFTPRQYSVYLYSDRPIYRPGQPVYFRGIVRSRDDVTYTVPEMDRVPVRVIDDRGEVIFDKELTLTPFGTFSDQLDLADDAPLGYYRLSVDITPEGVYPQEGGSLGFSVAEFRLPEFQVEVAPEVDQVVQGDSVRVAVDSTFFFGGAVSNATVEYRVVADPYFFNYDGPGYYDFIDFNYDEGPSEYYGFSGGLIASGSGETDDQGMFLIEVPAELEDTTQSQTFTIEATVTDESQQAVSGRANVIVHKGEVYIGAQPEGYVGTAGQESTINIISVDWDSEPVANQFIDVEVVERRWSNVQEEDENGRTIWVWEVEEIPIVSGDVVTDAEGLTTFSYTPPNGGVYKIIIRTRDEAGNEVVASTTMWVSSREFVSWRQQNSNRIDLIADRSDYQVGDTAEILIASPFQGTTEALIAVERGEVMVVEHVKMDSNSFIYKLPITPEFAPNVYVTVMLVKGVDAFNPVAAFRMGVIQLSVDTSQKVISFEIEPDTELAGPRETVSYTIRTTDYKGDPVQAEVGVSLTDLASLSIAGPNSGPLLPFFYGEQGLAVRTSTPLTINTDQLTQTTLDTIKGGGGGGAEFGIFEIRGNFVDTAYWDGSLVTDANGEAQFSVMLPDNLTTWRLDARAITAGRDGVMLVGQDTFDLLSTKPLLIRPVTPRFFIIGDQLTLAAVVNNNSGEALSVEVSLEGKGVTFAGERAQTFVIPAEGRQRIEWPVTVDDVENVELIFFAQSEDGSFNDASRPAIGQGDDRLLPVYKYEVPEVVGTAGVMREGGSRTESILLPRRFDVTQGELTVNVEPSLAATTIDGLDYLENFPHQCTEQTVSRFLPNIMTFRALDNLGLADAELEANLSEAVHFALQRLYATQHADGGWGWFVNDRSNVLTTAYAIIGLSEASDQRFTVDQGVIQRAQGFLRSQFIVPGLDRSAWELNRQTFILYALARSGAPDVARTVTMYENRDRLSLYARSFLALTLYTIDPEDDQRTNVLLSDLNNAAIASATGMHWEESFRDYYNWNTNTRTTAIALSALVKLKPESDLIPNVVRWLMVARSADAWETTQETAWAVMALTDWMVASGELQPDYDYSATLNDERLTEGTASPDTVREKETLIVDVRDLLADEANKLVLSRTDGEGVLYYTAHMRSFLPVPEIDALNRGVIVERRYTLIDDENKTSITEGHVGDVVQVRLTIIVPNSLHYVVVEDPIPAGAEAVNPGLETSQQIGTQPGLDKSDPLSRGWGWWWFSNIEFRDEKVVLYSTFLPAGTYEYVYTMRLGLEGTYNVIPATGQEFYFPEVYGRSAGSTFTILPLDE